MITFTGNTKVLSVGTYLPPTIVSSTSLMEEIHSESRFGIPTNWIDTRIGVLERRMAPAEAMPSELAVEAAREAIRVAGIHPMDIGAIIYAGIESDYVEPGTAHIIQGMIESDAICFDIKNACQGPINALAVADGIIAAGQMETVLICTASLAGKVVRDVIDQINKQPDDYMRDRLGILTCGDAGAAMIVTKATSKARDDAGLKHMAMISKGGWEKHCYYRYENGVLDAQMLMKGMTEAIDELHTSLISNTYHYLDWQVEEVDHLISHQVGKKTFRDLSKISGVPQEKMTEIFVNCGNITTCSIPVAMKKANLQPGNKILLMGGGSGFSTFQGGMIW